MFERLRDWWEHLAPRERKMMSLLGVTAVVCVFGFVGYQINDGLNRIAERNAASRKALGDLAANRDSLVAEKGKAGAAAAVIGEEAPPLATYLEGIEGEVGVQIRNSTEKPTLTKGKFHEKSLQVMLYNVTLAELAQFLKRVEIKSPAVVTQRLYVKRSPSQPDRMDRVEITVATYERARPKGGEAKDKEREHDAGTVAGKPQQEGATP